MADRSARSGGQRANAPAARTTPRKARRFASGKVRAFARTVALGIVMVLGLIWTPLASANGAQRLTGRVRRDRQRVVGRLDPDHGRDDGDLEARIGRTEIVAHGLCVEASGDLFGRRHHEGVTGGRQKPAGLEFLLERLQFGLGGFGDGIDAAESSASAASLRLWKRDMGFC